MLSIDNISFFYQENQIISNLSVSVRAGEHLCIMGESGCGKSTLLKLIYGFISPGSGIIENDGEKILGPEDRLIPGMDFMKYVAQDFGLMPFETVSENVGKFLSNTDRLKKSARVLELLELTDMTEFASRKGVNLSGGQQQRIAIAKALALQPRILLLDEPFSQIDRLHKGPFAKNLFRFCKLKQISCIVATHDSMDAMGFADRILVLKDGKMVQESRPEEIYSNPKNEYVAKLIGSANVVNSKILYPNQLKPSNEGFGATVVANYFQGDHYLIGAKTETGILTFKNPTKLEVGRLIHLEICE